MIRIVFCSVLAVTVCGKSNSSVTPEQLADIRSKLLTSGLTCIMKHPLALANIKVLGSKVLPDGENSNCLVACVFKSIGVMDEMGYFNTTSSRNLTEQVFKNDTKNLATIKKIIQECTFVNGAPTTDGNKGCERAKLLYDCLNKSADENNFHLDFF